MTHISHATIKNYKSIRDAAIDFSVGLNVIIGQNGSGKTNFVNAMNDVAIGETDISECELYLTAFYKNNNYHVTKTGSLKDEDEYDYTSSLFFYKENDILEIDSLNLMLNKNKEYQPLREFIRFLYFTTIVQYGVSFGNIEPFNIEYLNNNLKVRSNYKGLKAIMLQNYSAIKDVEYDFIKDVIIFPKELVDILNEFSPIKDLKFLQTNIQVYENNGKMHYDNIQIQFQINEKWLYWQQLSDGTKRLFYVLTELYLAQGIVFIEEPELGIHPHQLHDLMRFITEQAKTKQIILTTHSPQVLNHLTSDELHKIIICEMTDKGTKMRHLTEKQTQKAQNYMKSQLSLGDYWVHADLEPSKDDVI
jgi:predicted ATP-dependent endonuclease of OLD family